MKKIILSRHAFKDIASWRMDTGAYAWTQTLSGSSKINPAGYLFNEYMVIIKEDFYEELDKQLEQNNEDK